LPPGTTGTAGLQPEAQKWVNTKNDWTEPPFWGYGGMGRGWGVDGAGYGGHAAWEGNRPVRGWNGDSKWRNWSGANRMGSWGEEIPGAISPAYSRSRSLSAPHTGPPNPGKPGASEVQEDENEPTEVFYGNPSGWSYKPKIEGQKKKTSSVQKKVVKSNKNSLVVEDPKTHQRKCVICHIEFTSKSHESDHMKGKPHAKNLSKLGLGQPQGDGLFGKCQLCKIVYTSAQHAVTHLFSTTHTINQNVFNSVKKSVITRKKEKEESEKKRQQIIDETLKAEAKKLWDLKTGNFMKNVMKNEDGSKQLPAVKAEGAKQNQSGDWKVMYSQLQALNSQALNPQKRDLSSLELEEPPDKNKMPPLESDEPQAKKQKVPDAIQPEENEAGKAKKAQKFCTECGERLWPDAKFCGECGGRIGGLPS